AAGQMREAQSKPRFDITHLEIRRVQNGFVVMGINAKLFESPMYGGERQPQRASFIAKDIPELAALLEWIVTGEEIGWMPSVDLPIVDLFRRYDLPTDAHKKLMKDAVREALYEPQIMAQTAVPETVARPGK